MDLYGILGIIVGVFVVAVCLTLLSIGIGMKLRVGENHPRNSLAHALGAHTAVEARALAEREERDRADRLSGGPRKFADGNGYDPDLDGVA